MIRRLAFVLAVLAGLALGTACPQPLPPTPPGPQPGDVFTGQVFDCRAPIVAAERVAASVPVHNCLMDTAPTECLVLFATDYNPATIACVARDIGASANAAVLAGSMLPADTRMADAARGFIVREGMGFK